MRPFATTALALVLALPLALASPAAQGVVSCEPQVLFQTYAVLPCTVSATVTKEFLVKVYGSAGTTGVVVVDARGPGSVLEFACPFAAFAAVCVGPVGVGSFAGSWTFTARPAAANFFLVEWLKLEVAFT